MDRENTNTLWSQTQKEEKRSKGAGAKYWNKWANDLLAKKVALVQEGKWSQNCKGEGKNEETKKYISDSLVDFSDCPFENEVNFVGFIFPHMVNFRDCVFKKYTSFSGSTFGGPVDFNGAKFHHDVFFQEAIFNDRTQFNRVSFSGFAVFYKAEFWGHASFESARFDGSLYLPDAKFINEVPDFMQAHFRGPLRLDNVEIPPPEPFLIKGSIDTAAKYRALKKMAIESHDHKRELEFFAGELMHRRGKDDPKGSAAYRFGMIYERLADFGRSLMWPFYWWLATVGVLGSIYFAVSIHIFPIAEVSRNISEWFWKSIYLSFLNSLPIIGFGGGGRDRTLRYLFGATEDMSLWLDALFILQNIWSAILIFLFLLALRNHFKIK